MSYTHLRVWGLGIGVWGLGFRILPLPVSKTHLWPEAEDCSVVSDVLFSMCCFRCAVQMCCPMCSSDVVFPMCSAVQMCCFRCAVFDLQFRCVVVGQRSALSSESTAFTLETRLEGLLGHGKSVFHATHSTDAICRRRLRSSASPTSALYPRKEMYATDPSSQNGRILSQKCSRPSVPLFRHSTAPQRPPLLQGQSAMRFLLDTPQDFRHWHRETRGRTY